MKPIDSRQWFSNLAMKKHCHSTSESSPAGDTSPTTSCASPRIISVALTSLVYCTAVDISFTTWLALRLTCRAAAGPFKTALRDYMGRLSACIHVALGVLASDLHMYFHGKFIDAILGESLDMSYNIFCYGLQRHRAADMRALGKRGWYSQHIPHSYMLRNGASQIRELFNPKGGTQVLTSFTAPDAIMRHHGYMYDGRRIIMRP
jgi:hypothetical protein